ncbi:MAG: C-terminal binding protein [Gammaproteobacteria bacterium]|nr:C-terminal binding protein [Gammaproteobacteria bacterium]MDH5345545.1 C-terminal binding protein [Gammaproteobacteria bacterium]
MNRVVIADIAPQSVRDLDVERLILGPQVDVRHFNGAANESVLVSACRDADVVITDLAPMTRDVIGELRKCRLISVAGTGYSSIDLQAAQDAKISVCAIPEYCTDEVADHVMLMILALSRRLLNYHEQIQIHRSWQFETHRGVAVLRDLRLGVIGFGKIGAAVASRARGFGMSVLAHDRDPAKSESQFPDVRFCDLATLLRESDVISLNCSMSADNVNLIDAAAFARMQRRPIFINCARGEMVDEAALVKALDTGQIAGAGLDVLRGEVPDLDALTLAGRDNVILTPHVAFYSTTSLLESRKISARNARNFLDGRHELVERYVFRP